MSPELIYPERFNLAKSRPTEKSDCYAMGMVIYEVLSGQTPFFPSIPVVIIGKVLEGKRPQRPQGEEGKLFTDAIWGLLELCWKHQPSDRANIRAMLSCLEGNPPVWLPPDAGGCFGVNGDQPDATLSDSGMYSRFASALLLIILVVLGPSPSRPLPGAGGKFPDFPSLIQN